MKNNIASSDQSSVKAKANNDWSNVKLRLIPYVIALLAAVGSSLQHYLAFASFLGDISNLSWGAMVGMSVAFGGVLSGLVNLSVNFECLERFFKRFKKPMPSFKDKDGKPLFWKKFRYYAGSLVFILTGVLFGTTAVAFGSIGVIGGIAIAAGVFVAILMLIQELETWLESFDEKDENENDKDKEEKLSTSGKVVGFIISLGNVVALSLLFTLGFATFLMGVGVPVLPALITGFVVGFTGGAFTEFYFYNAFLSKFCGNIKDKWSKFSELPASRQVIGAISITINAVVNSALCYSGVFFLNKLLLSASMSPIPGAAIIVFSIFAGLASLILCSSFWIDNSKFILTPWKYGQEENKKEKVEEEQPAVTLSLTDTATNMGVPQATPPQKGCWSSLIESVGLYRQKAAGYAPVSNGEPAANEENKIGANDEGQMPAQFPPVIRYP